MCRRHEFETSTMSSASNQARDFFDQAQRPDEKRGLIRQSFGVYLVVMNSNALRSLMLLVGMSLAFPQGWCCSFLIPIAARAANSQAKVCSTGLVRDCCSKRLPVDSDPSPARPVPAQNCPCADRNATVTNSSFEFDHVEIGVFAINVDRERPLVTIDAVRHSISLSSVPPRQFNVLYCRWLC